MKTCSYCGAMNDNAARVCTGCGEKFPVPTREKVDPVHVDPSLEPAIVATFGSLEQASVLKTRLEAAGIEAWIPEEYGAQVFSAVIPLEPISVQVAAKDLPTAKEVLAQPPPPAEEPTSPGGP